MKYWASIFLMTIWTVASAQTVPTAQEARTSWSLENGKFSLALEAGWEGTPGLFDIPLVLIGPTENDSHPTLSVIPTQGSGELLKAVDLKNHGSAYKKGRENWLRQNGGKPLAYFPGRELKLGSGKAYAYGYRYELGSENFVEHTYFVSCKNKYYQLQSLMTETENAKHGKAAERIVESLLCE